MAIPPCGRIAEAIKFAVGMAIQLGTGRWRRVKIEWEWVSAEWDPIDSDETSIATAIGSAVIADRQQSSLAIGSEQNK